jgi:phosphatidylglycerophosphate synthase
MDGNELCMTLVIATSIGDNATPLWGISNQERTKRLALAKGHEWASADHIANAGDAQIIANNSYAFDPSWYAHISANPGLVLTKEGQPVLAHATNAAEAAAVIATIKGEGALPDSLTEISIESGATIENKELRKRITPFVDRLIPENIRSLERASYFGAYKGVTDILTKYLWPEWALVLTRISAKIGMSPNQVTAIGFALCLYAMYLFWYGHYWAGMAAGLVFMVLDTVDGKLARCTITSSWWGNIFDHGIDLIHPPFWWWAWCVGLSAWGLALSTSAFLWVMAAIVVGYVVQRLIEGVFMRRNGMMHIHVWQKIDSDFRLITARRNPNMVILFVSMLFSRPDIGLLAIAWWTGISCAFHLVRLIQAEIFRKNGGTIRSWMQDPA